MRRRLARAVSVGQFQLQSNSVKQGVGHIVSMHFEILGPITEIELITTGRRIRTLARLRKRYGSGQWRKLKGVALVRLASGHIRRAELHCYEAHGIGKKDVKIKRFLSD